MASSVWVDLAISKMDVKIFLKLLVDNMRILPINLYVKSYF